MSLSRPTAPWHPEVKSELLNPRVIKRESRLYKPLSAIIAQLRHGEHWSAYESARLLLKRYAWSRAVHYCAGYAARHIGEYALSLSHYAQVSERDRLGSLAAQEIMTRLYQQKQHQTLIMFARARLTLIEEPETYYMLGVAHQARGHFKGSREAFSAALDCAYQGAPDRIVYRLALAGNLYLQRDIQGALDLLSVADRADQRSPQLWLLTARCQVKLGHISDGDLSLKRALRLAPQSAQVHITCGDVLRKRDPKRALKHYHRVLRRYEAPAEVYLRVSGIYERLGAFEDAIQYLELYRGLMESPDTRVVDQRLKTLREMASRRPKRWFQRFYG